MNLTLCKAVLVISLGLLNTHSHAMTLQQLRAICSRMLNTPVLILPRHLQAAPIKQEVNAKAWTPKASSCSKVAFVDIVKSSEGQTTSFAQQQSKK